MFDIKRDVDELAMLNEPFKDEEISIYVINGLNKDFKKIFATIRSRIKKISYEDLHARLLKHEAYINQFDPHSTDNSQIVAYIANRNFGNNRPNIKKFGIKSS